MRPFCSTTSWCEDRKHCRDVGRPGNPSVAVVLKRRIVFGLRRYTAQSDGVACRSVVAVRIGACRVCGVISNVVALSRIY